LLARVAVAIGHDLSERRGSITVVDVCTGSGNVALSVAKGVPSAFVHAADLSEEAVALAEKNARFLNLQDRVAFRAGDLLSPFETEQFLGAVDLLTCNPPYISSAKVPRMPEEIARHEPHLAFDGGPLGITILMRLMQQAPHFLRPGAWLAFEVGLGQGPSMLKRLKSSAAFDEVRPHMDANNDIRVVAARAASSPT
jgi:release factor glutamine methyltransferase